MLAVEAVKKEKDVMARLTTVLSLVSTVLVLALGGFIIFERLGEDEVQTLVKTKTIEITDDAGRTKAVLTTTASGLPSVTLLDDAGNMRAALFLGDNGSPSVVLSDSPRLALTDRNGKIRSVQYLDATGVPVLAQMDANGLIHYISTVDNTGQPSIQLFDAEGKSAWKAP